MPPRPKVITELSDDDQAELNRRLIGNGFSNYTALHEWLTSCGYKISRSTVHAYGQKFEQKCQALRAATEQARAIVSEAPDDEDAVGNVLLRMTQEKLFNIMMDLEVDPKQINLPKLVHAITQISRASVNLNKWRSALRRATEAAADKVATYAREKGMSAATARWIRNEVLGIRKAVDDENK